MSLVGDRTYCVRLGDCCRNCVYWKPLETPSGILAGAGQCRKRAPIDTYPGTYDPRWPLSLCRQICGDFETLPAKMIAGADSSVQIQENKE